MPPRVVKARIALLNRPLEVGFKKSKYKSEITITRVAERIGFLKADEARVREMVDKIAGAGATVVFCNKGIDEAVKYELSKNGILAFERTGKQYMKKLAKSTGAGILETLDGIGIDDLGLADVVEEAKIHGNRMAIVRGCKNPRALSIIIRGGNQNVVDEVKRSFQDGFGVIRTFLREKKIVAGGGALEMELSRIIQKFARTFEEKKQLAIEAFGESLVEIPRVIAKNSGMKPLDVLTTLRKRHEEGCIGCGVDVNRGVVRDMYSIGVVEPARMKIQALESASEVVNAILRIDGVVSSRYYDKNKTQGFVEGEKEE
jgi:chaperonin GroEL (HSP60 family)